MLIDWLLAAAIGFVSGVLSGAFGIGGGIITTPAIRLIIGAPALIAVGTPLPVIIPSAITGARTYLKNGNAHLRAGLTIGVAGAGTAVLGAIASDRAGGRIVLIGTALLIAYASVEMLVQVWRPPVALEVSDAGGACSSLALPLWRLIAIGVLAGLYSGFFGLGGGFVIVPLLTRWIRLPLKCAIGTSLVTVALLAVPGTITHALLGHIDWGIALGLTVGVIPGAWVGAHVSLGAGDRGIRIGFSMLMLAVAAWLTVSELGIVG